MLSQPSFLGILLGTDFSVAGRFTASTIAGSGVNTFGGTSGLSIVTGATGTSSAGASWIAMGGNDNIFLGNPRAMATVSLAVKGSDCQFYWGMGVVTTAGAGLTFTTNHAGFKVVWSASGAASLFATQGAGITETASAALTTVALNDSLDLVVDMATGVGAAYYWRKNGSALSAPTTLTANLPAAGSQVLHTGISNVAVASSSQMNIQAMSYQR